MLCGGRTRCTMLTHMPQQFRGYNGLEQRSPLHRDADGVKNVLAWCALKQVAIGSSFQRGNDTLIVIKGSEDNDARAAYITLTRVMAQTANGFDTIHDGHFEIQQEDIGLQFQRQTQGLVSAGSLLRSANYFEVRLGFQHSTQSLTHNRVI